MRPDVHITWVLQPGPATLVRGHRSVDEILIFDRAQGLARVRRHSPRSLPTRRVRSRHQPAGLLQGRHRHAVHARAGEARLRSRARARLQLAVHDATAFRRTRSQHVQDQYFEFLTALGRSARAGRCGISGRGRTSARAQREFFSRSSTVPPRRSSSRRASRRRTGCPSAGPRWPTRSTHDFGLQPVLVGGRSPARARTPSRSSSSARAHKPVVRARQRAAQSRRHSRRIGAGARAGHRSAAHGGRARPAGDQPDRLHESRSAPARIGAFTISSSTRTASRARTIRSAMENRLDRMPRITVRDVLDRVERWRTTYASGRRAGRSRSASPSARAAVATRRLSGESHHGEVVAVDALDDRRAEALNAVRAGLVHRLAGIDVALDLVVARARESVTPTSSTPDTTSAAPARPRRRSSRRARGRSSGAASRAACARSRGLPSTSPSTTTMVSLPIDDGVVVDRDRRRLSARESLGVSARRLARRDSVSSMSAGRTSCAMPTRREQLAAPRRLRREDDARTHQRSSQSVTGPSFTSSTCMSAPNSPVSTRTPRSRSSATNRS